jgi:ABC-type polysaccharide/polyol phosphate export permease
MQFGAILWKESLDFKSKFISISLSTIMGPLLYLIAFGWGLGDSLQVNGGRYIVFVMPGIIAMNAMTNGFGVIANDLNMARIYLKTFEALMTSPVKMSLYTIARITANVLRSLYGATLLFLLSLVFNAPLKIDWFFILVLVLNCYVFSTIGFIAGILVQSHADMAKLSNFVITPMSFLCGTFFPLEKFPMLLGSIFKVLPLTQAVRALREGFTTPESFIAPLVLAAYIAVLMPVAIHLCGRAE